MKVNTISYIHVHQQIDSLHERCIYLVGGVPEVWQVLEFQPTQANPGQKDGYMSV